MAASTVRTGKIRLGLLRLRSRYANPGWNRPHRTRLEEIRLISLTERILLAQFRFRSRRVAASVRTFVTVEGRARLFEAPGVARRPRGGATDRRTRSGVGASERAEPSRARPSRADSHAYFATRRATVRERAAAALVFFYRSRGLSACASRTFAFLRASMRIVRV